MSSTIVGCGQQEKLPVAGQGGTMPPALQQRIKEGLDKRGNAAAQHPSMQPASNSSGS